MVKSRSSRQYLGVLAINPPNVVLAEMAPTSANVAFDKATLWLDTVNEAVYMYPGSGDWIALGSGTTGAVVSLTGSSGGAITPVGGNIDVLGDSADGVSVVGTAGTLTINVAAATTTQRGTLETSTDAESVTGTSDAVAVTPASLTARLAAPGAIGGTTPAAGTFTTIAGSTITASGNIILNGSATQLRAQGGAATDFIGTATLVAGTVTVANTNIAAGDRIFVQRIAANASTTLGELSYTISAGASFTIDSLILGTPGSVQTGDASSVTYFIVREI